MNLDSSIRVAGGALVAPNSFSRLFPSHGGLHGWEPPGLDLDKKLDAIEASVESVFADPASVDPPKDATLPAAYTFLGQFITHDLSFGTAGEVALSTPLGALPNTRTPGFDLDSVYGAGSMQAPYMFDPDDPRLFLIGRNEAGEPDLPRVQDRFGNFARQGRALIGDPRNDENVIVAQLHLAFLLFHNRCIADGMSFDEARMQTRLHYQWIVVSDFLERLCRPELIAALIDGTEPFVLFGRESGSESRLPVEFSFGAFRALHTLIGPEYELSDPLHAELGEPLPFIGAPHDLRGLRSLPARWSVQWDRFLDRGQGATQAARQLGLHMAKPLAKIPLPAGAPGRERNLLYRDLVRGWRARIPSGQALTTELRRLLPGKHITAVDPGSDDPLLLYLLKEAAAERAQHPQSSRRFGPLGERIVAETLVGLLRGSPTSILHAPSLSRLSDRKGGRYELWDFLEWAGMPMTEAALLGRVAFANRGAA